MNKYINITKYNFNDYLFKDIECEFSDYDDFSEIKKGKLIGIFETPKHKKFLYTCSNTMAYYHCRTIDSDYKEEKPVFDPEACFGDIKGPSKSIPDHKETKISNLPNMTKPQQLDDAGYFIGDNVDFSPKKKIQDYIPPEKNPDLMEMLEKSVNKVELSNSVSQININGVELYVLLKEIIKRLPE